MATTPSNYSTPTISRAGTLISELNIVIPRTASKFFRKFDYTPYMMLTQMQKNGSLKITDENAENKLFYWYEQFGRYMGFFTVNANVSGANGAAVTMTIAAGSYSAAGARSLPEVGMAMKNARTGVEGRVTAVNKTTPNAHTVTIQPVKASQSFAVLAGDEILNRGFKYVGEASDYTTTIVQNIGKYTNYCSQLRKDTKITDLAKAERIDFSFNGQNYFWYKQMDDDNKALIQEKELFLLDSNLTDNLGYSESGTAGLIQQITANGQTRNYGTFSAMGTFASIERWLDDVGAPMEYDFLSDTDQNIDISNAIANEFPNGALLYDQDDLRRGFRSFTPYFRKFNFTRYTPISERRMYGTTGAGVFNNFGLLVPRSTVSINGDVRVNDVPQMVVRHQEIVPGQQWVVSEYGALSANGKSSKMELGVVQEGYFGLQVNGADQFMILSKS